MSMRYETILALAFMMSGLSSGLGAADESVKFRGDAHDLVSGAFLYSENHTEYYENGVHTHSRVSYRDKAGKEFVSKVITFLPQRLQPSYELKDARDGYSEGIRRVEGRVVYFARRKGSEPLKEKAVAAPSPAVFDGGFDYFVRDNFTEICAGKNKAFYFAVPIELDYFRFRVARQEVGSLCRMNLEIANVVLRQFVKPIRLWYDMADKRLRKYEGISNINGPDGKSLKVRIVFRYAGDKK